MPTKRTTICVDAELARWLRVRAAEAEISVSRLAGDMLQEKMLSEQGYRAACERFFSVRPRRLREPGNALPTRHQVHDRAGSRGHRGQPEVGEQR